MYCNSCFIIYGFFRDCFRSSFDEVPDAFDCGVSRKVNVCVCVVDVAVASFQDSSYDSCCSDETNVSKFGS